MLNNSLDVSGIVRVAKKPFRQEFFLKLSDALRPLSDALEIHWHEQMPSKLRHELKVGNPTSIKAGSCSRHNSDRRDADWILDLLDEDEFLIKLVSKTKYQNSAFCLSFEIA